MKINDDVSKIEEIGQRGQCTVDELKYFLPNHTTLGNESIFNISFLRYPELKSALPFLINVIKGLHIIETRYGGFGSPSKTYELIKYLIDIDPTKGEEMYNWIASNGGNYYIDENITYIEQQKRSEEAAKRRSEILLNDQESHAEAALKRKEIQEEHGKKTLETKELYEEYLEKFQNMDNEQLINTFNDDVGKSGWVSARAKFISAIHNEFIRRGFDYSSIGDDKKLSIKNKIMLENNKITIIENAKDSRKWENMAYTTFWNGYLCKLWVEEWTLRFWSC